MTVHIIVIIITIIIIIYIFFKCYFWILVCPGEEIALRDLASAWLFETCSVKLGMPEKEVVFRDLTPFTDKIKGMANIFSKVALGNYGKAHSELLKAGINSNSRVFCNFV